MSDATDSNGTDTDPNEVIFTTKVNGTDKPVTRAQAIRYAQQVGSMAEQAAALSKRQDDLDQWDRFVAGYTNDPDGTLVQLATAAGGRYSPKGSPKGAAVPDDEDDDDAPNSALLAEIQALKAQVAQVTGDLSGYRVQNSIDKEIADLRGGNPQMTDDEFRDVITKASTYGGLPLKEAHRLVKMEAIENGRGSDQGQEDRTKLPITPGSGTPAVRVGDNGAKLDYAKPLKDVLKDSWQLTAAKLGISPDL